MNTERIKKISSELWMLALEAEHENGTPTKGKKSHILGSCIEMLKNATYIIDNTIEIYETL